MVQAAELAAGQVKGLVPGLNPQQVQEPFVIEGSNFIVDAEGPKAFFGGNIYTYKRLFFGEYAQTFKIGGVYYVAADDGIYLFDAAEECFYPVFVTEVASEIYPWSMARVGGAYYFARKGLTYILEYIVSTSTWTSITTDVPPNPHAVTESNGRLICVGEDVVAWSEISNGANFTTDVDLGIGAQSLAIIGFGDVLGVFSIDDGYITLTSSGILKSKFIDGINPYFHTEISRTELPLSAFTITRLTKSILAFLSVSGFYTLSSKGLEVWQPLMGSYLTQTRFPISAYETPGIYNLTFVSETQVLFLSIAENDNPLKFTIAYALYVPRDEWGVYNREHANFGITHSAFFSTQRPVMVAFASDNYIYELNDLPNFETKPVFPETTFLHGDPSPQPRSEIGVNVFCSGLNLYTNDVSSIINPGPYDDFTLDFLPRVFEGLSSEIIVGLLRVSDQLYHDTLNYFTELFLASEDSGAAQEFVDWLLIGDGVSDEDWNALADANEDWGFGVVAVVDYTAEFEGTLDGLSVFEDQTEELTSYVIENSIRVYKPYISGIYGRVKLTATIAGESFHLKYLSATGNIGGRL